MKLSKVRILTVMQNRMVYSEVTSQVEKTRAVTRYGYDALGRRTLTQDVAGQTLRTVYDGKGEGVK